MFEIRVHKKVSKFLEGLDRQTQKRCKEAIDQLSQNPFVNRSGCDLKKLSGERFAYRLRVGDCRFVYVVDGRTIFMEAMRSEEDTRFGPETARTVYGRKPRGFRYTYPKRNLR